MMDLAGDADLAAKGPGTLTIIHAQRALEFGAAAIEAVGGAGALEINAVLVLREIINIVAVEGDFHLARKQVEAISGAEVEARRADDGGIDAGWRR